MPFVFPVVPVLPGPPNTSKPTPPAAKSPGAKAIPPALLEMAKPVPVFVLTNEKNQFYVLPRGGREMLFLHPTPEGAERMRTRISEQNASLGARLSIRVVSMADFLRWNVDPKFPYGISVVPAVEDYEKGVEFKGEGQPDPAFPVFLIRNTLTKRLATAETPKGPVVPVMLSYKEVETALSEMRKRLGKEGESAKIEVVDLATFLNTVAAIKDPKSIVFRISVPKSSIEYVKRLGPSGPLKR